MAGSKVGVFFFRPTLGGGTTTFTAQLVQALCAVGSDPMIYRVYENGDEKIRQFGKYEDTWFSKISVEEAKLIVGKMPTIMSAPANSKLLVYPDLQRDLVKRGMRVVFHDPKEFVNLEGLKLPTRPICVRPTVKKFYKNAVWIPHPYRRVEPEMYVDVKRKLLAISIARIATAKRSKILLDANRLLPKKYQIRLRGAEHRLYTYGLQKKYSDVFQQCGSTFQYPMTFDAPVRVCASAMFNFDMSWFPDDGGGTQYSQLEAMDAGTVNVMHEDWWRNGPGEMKPGKHVVSVSSAEDIAKLLRNYREPEQYFPVIVEGMKLLKNHAPEVVGKLYKEELNR